MGVYVVHIYLVLYKKYIFILLYYIVTTIVYRRGLKTIARIEHKFYALPIGPHSAKFKTIKAMTKARRFMMLQTCFKVPSGLLDGLSPARLRVVRVERF